MSEGDDAPDFELPDQDGTPVRLSSFRGKPVVLYFYPKADTPGCTKQACGVRDRKADYDSADAVVLGVSPDEPTKLRKFADKHGLPFTLLGDADHEVAERYGVRKFWVTQRSTFVIDAEGKIAKVFPKVQPKTHDELVLDALSALGPARAD